MTPFQYPLDFGTPTVRIQSPRSTPSSYQQNAQANMSGADDVGCSVLVWRPHDGGGDTAAGPHLLFVVALALVTAVLVLLGHGLGGRWLRLRGMRVNQTGD